MKEYDAVFNGSKILIWKQITTANGEHRKQTRCIQWLKDTNLKANHNCIRSLRLILIAVFNGSKILIWKQITTHLTPELLPTGCIQWLKDTNLKANHNMIKSNTSLVSAVFNGSKILIWKQITTSSPGLPSAPGCIQWLKDTNLKANHNRKWFLPAFASLYSMAQRY